MINIYILPAGEKSSGWIQDVMRLEKEGRPCLRETRYFSSKKINKSEPLQKKKRKHMQGHLTLRFAQEMD